MLEDLQGQAVCPLRATSHSSLCAETPIVTDILVTPFYSTIHFEPIFLPSSGTLQARRP